METIIYNGRDIPVLYDVDCVVVGGGTGGAAAAISALEETLSVLVIEKNISLGGTQTNSLVSPMMPTYVETQRINRMIIERLHAENIRTSDGTTTCSWFNVESLSYVLEQLITERGGDILYDSRFIDCIKNDQQINYIIVSTCSGLVAIKGKTFIDSTADASLSQAAGIPVTSGDAKGQNQQISFRFEMGGINIDQIREFVLSKGETFCKIDDPDFFEIAMVPGKGHVLEPLFRKGVENGDLLEEDMRYFQAFTQPGKPTVMSFNCPHVPGIYQTTDPILRSKAVTRGREMIQRLSKFLPAYLPGFEQSFLLREATQLGIRESWRITGKYVLTEHDYIKRARFDDGIARGDWYIDVHSVAKEDIEHAKLSKGEYYEIPYRSLVADEAENLIVVGRHISSTFLMQASLRIQPTVRDLGQVAGMACAYSVRMNTALNQMDGAVLKQQLQLVEE
ncbi:FAD-dependent oxidoreductase [Jeotgalibacillus haloalkalitolerans]|uniref:FAD-dependent oxidoreductase n=1 Tax=Jeotgalibacillus haloalkalitolerans TaxID=3104292 RepID=A0ABU5KHH2_9BACL|nr:FAD-dependent oxidoreductase [Jeotgalibacillus sp. HH7-29]MDZ5710682.1 FAD-dependent oxidoreductase [Jeotgalibacillus sp. HH7-29]